MASDPRDLHERLKPFQRILSDLAEAIDAPNKMREEIGGLTQRCIELRDEEARLRADRDQRQAELAAAEKEHAQRMADHRAAFEAARVEHEAALAKIAADRAQTEALWAERRSTLEHEYARDRDDYRAKIDAARGRLEQLQAEESAVAERLAPLLTRRG